MPTIRILVYLAVWKRPRVTEICFAGIERMKTHPDYSIEALAVISEEEMIPLCEKYGVHWVIHPNTPLSNKKNFGLQKAKDFEFDYLMEIGSDDLITNDLLTHYKGFWGKPFFGIKDAAYIHSEDGACRRLISKSTYGAGRMIAREVLEKMRWKLWADNKHRGLDNNSVFAMIKKGVMYTQVPPMDVPGVIDIKSDVNLWPFRYDLGVEYDIVNLYDKVSEKERKMIECLITDKISEGLTEG